MFARLNLAVLSACVLAVYLCAPLSAPAGTDQTPIVLKSSTTIQHNGAGGDPTIRFNESSTGIPISVFFKVIPTGGTVTLRLDGDLEVTWNDNDVGPGNSFDTAIAFSPNSSTIGSIELNYNYLVESAYRINFDSIFHDTLSYWGQVPALRSYLIAGFREGNFRDIASVPESAATALIAIPNTKNPFLLADLDTFPPTLVDTVSLTYDFAPYPCVRLKAVATIRTEVGFRVGTDTLCVRYAPPADTLCWKAQSGFSCQTDYSGSWILTATIPCETVQDFVVPLCPVRAAGHAQVTIGTEIDVDTLIFSYTCGPTPPPDIELGTPTGKDTTWIDQNLSFGTDRDDAIYTIPVTLANVAVALKDTLGVTIGHNGTIKQNDRYSINWGAIDNALTSCCSGNDSLRIMYRDVDVLSEASACFDYIDPQVADAVPRTLDWTVPNITCFSSGTKFRVFLEFYCPSTGNVLYRAWSHSFTYQP
ncbi:MAG: hypothetical protein OEN01_08430 [Candidatus Krumholzibacteria bacterium]|nr:hypothetical protein [Candidatus Krumholzibacteria bacterium]